MRILRYLQLCVFGFALFIPGVSLADNGALCPTCTRVVVLNSKKATCLEQYYDAALVWYKANPGKPAAIHIGGCVPGLKITLRGVQESFSSADSIDPEGTIRVTEAGLICLHKEVSKLNPESLDPETIIDMKRICP